MSGKPDPGFTVGGFRPTGRYRIRVTWFFLWPVVEQLIEYSDGVFQWQRLGWMETVEFGRRIDK